MSIPFVFHADYVTPLPKEHRFPMLKFGKVYEHLIKDGIASIDQFHCPAIASPALLELAHDQKYVNSYLTGTIDPKVMRRIGFPWSAELVRRTRTAIGGTVLTAELALQFGVACNTAGGTHHAHADFGSGYCIFNDLAITARHVQQLHSIHRVLIVDLDVHQGDGTAAILAQDPSIFTFSMHCEKNFPYRKASSDLDVPLPSGLQDEEYLAQLQNHLLLVLEKFKPGLVLYDGGVDPHKDDALGKLALTDEGIFRRDWMVIEECLRRSIPVASVVGGGYSSDIDRLARRHCLVHRAASELFEQYALNNQLHIDNFLSILIP
ncbi:histone deacetylase [Chloroflexi bacterium TSY]|nr:histone deacetylase [Chloroflexi bacterium TSY]